MRKWSVAALTALSFSASVLALTIAQCSAYAQSADLVLCDRLAADPADPDKPADVKGTSEIAASDVATAIKFCRLASAKSRRALYQLGRAYAAGGQLPDAVATYRKAADKGSTAAMVELGVLFGTGTGVPKDLDQARALFERAAAGGNPRGTTNLMALADNGAAAPDPVAARALLTRAAEANSAEAQYRLGLMMADGIGGPKDDVAARAMFERAAVQGDPRALERLGAFAEDGRGGPKDKTAAKSYYEKAAALGDENAKAALERMRCPLLVKNKSGVVVGHVCF
jgi:uncharacterized protein